MLGEFNLIQRYFTRATPNALLGVGDDAALLSVRAGHELAISTDMLVSGTHFFPDADPFLLGHKTLAVNLSDLAAMGATPRWATLALSLPQIDEPWLAEFSRGFFTLAEQHGVELVGGDTTRGALTLSVSILGEVPSGQALRRDGAQIGDDIWLSGTVGEAALGLAHLQGKLTLSSTQLAICSARLHQPQPRVALGQALRGIAHSAIDISDGLLADLGHILQRSGVGATLNFDALAQAVFALPAPDSALRQRCILAGGDDYELCFTAPATCRMQIQQLGEKLSNSLILLGKIDKNLGCRVLNKHGTEIKLQEQGYDHFA